MRQKWVGKKSSLVTQMVKILLQCRRPGFNPWVGKILWRKDSRVGFPDSSVGQEFACSAGDPNWIPGSGRSPGEGKGYTLQYSGLENSMDCIVHGVTKSHTQLSNFHFHLRSHSKLQFEFKPRQYDFNIPALKHSTLLSSKVKEEILLSLVMRIEKAMASHSSTLAWKIPWTEEPGRLQSMGSLRVGHD